MPITDTQKDLIRQEAERLYTFTVAEKGFEKYKENQDRIVIYERAAYIKCATLYQEKLNLEREKAKVLVEGLKKLCSEENRPHMISIAFNTIDTYNKTIDNEK